MESNGYTQYVRGIWDNLYTVTLGTPIESMYLVIGDHYGLTLEEVQKDTEITSNIRHTMVLFYNYYNVWNKEGNPKKYEAYESVLSDMLHYLR